MKDLYFDRTTNRFVINPNSNTIAVRVEYVSEFIASGISDIVTERYMTDPETSGQQLLWKLTYSCPREETDYDLIDFSRNESVKHYKIDLSIYKLVSVIVSIDSYCAIMSMMERADK